VLAGEASREQLYLHAAQRAADVLVREYSTSFRIATALLPRRLRGHIRNIYALVRVADEIVDGAVESTEQARVALDNLEQDTYQAMVDGFSANVVVHAFATTARRSGIDAELVAPFFASMRSDLTEHGHDAASLATYLYGSAEVVGLMCLRVFLLDEPPADRDRRYRALAPGAKALGSAFQLVNFLRDIGDDAEQLGRRYLPWQGDGPLTERAKDRAVAEVRRSLATARVAIAELPPGSRPAVAVAYALFAELTTRVDRTPAAALALTRVRVPEATKAALSAVTVVRVRLTGRP
jgi:phytoene/squalene synthetase